MKAGKGLASIILASAKPKEDEEKEEMGADEGEQDEEEAKLAAAEDLIAAVNSGDATKVVEAFQSMKDLCY